MTTPPCEFCDFYAELEAAEAPLSDAELARLDALGQRWADIGRAVLAGISPEATP